VAKAVKNAKFYGQYPILHDFADYLSTLLMESIFEEKENIVLTSVPMYFWKKLQRGYNQSEILAKQIARNTNIPYISLIRKIRSHTPQSHLKKQERLKNIQNSFILQKQYINTLEGKTVIIVDDVVSTGATLSEITNLLRKAGVKKVCGLCIASN